MKNRNAKLDTKGFTLVELMVTLVLMVIALGIGSASLSAYARYTRFRSQKETAQTLFTAAQTRLTQYVADGNAPNLVKTCEGAALALNDGDTMLVSDLVDSDGYAVTPDAIWADRGGAAYGTLYSVTGTAADYAAYCAYKAGVGDAPMNAAVTALYDLLVPYLYDPSILNAGVCMEFDPAAGLVYSVFYAQDADFGFSYTGDLARVDIRNREERELKKRAVGYFGVTELGGAPETGTGYVRILDARLDNGNMLDLNWAVNSESWAEQEDTSLDAASLGYRIRLYDIETGQCVLLLEINHWGDETPTSGNAAFVSGTAPGVTQTVEAKVSRRPKNGSSELAEIGTYTFPAYQDGAGRLHLILDAADLGATEYLYRSECGVTDALDTQAAWDASKLKNSFSLHRFFLESFDTKNIIAGVSTFADGTHQAAEERQTNVSSLYYASSASASGTETDAISNARHLYNLRYASVAAGQKTDYILAGDINWETFVKQGQLYDTRADGWNISNHGTFSGCLKAGQTKNGDGTLVQASADFPGISQLAAGAAFQSQNLKKPFCITGLSLNSETDAAALVPGYDAASKTMAGTGLFVYNFGSIRAIKLDAVSVIGKAHVGSFCGQNYGTLGTLEVAGGAVYGLSYVGGICGSDGIAATTPMDASGSISLQYQALTNRADVTGHSYVGGIMGRSDAGKRWVRPLAGSPTQLQSVSCSFSDCENYGAVRGDWKALSSSENSAIKAVYQGLKYDADANGNYTSDARFIGGIVGYAGGRTDESNGKQNASLKTDFVLTACKSAPAVSKTEQTAAANGGDICRGTCVGGIAGCTENTALDACTVLAPTQNGVMAGNRMVGGIVGAAYGETELHACTVNAPNIKGRCFTGGLAGYADAGAIVSGCAVSGGSIEGTYFVGGFAGLDAAGIQMLGKENSSARPASVKGSYFVGGCCGAVLHASADDGWDAIVALDNPDGTVAASLAFAGGYTGLAARVASAADWLPAPDGTCPALLAGLMALSGRTDQLAADLAATEAAFSGGRCGGRFQISGMTGGTSVVLKNVSAAVGAGGIVGYVPDGAAAVLTTLTSRAAVSTSASLQNTETAGQTCAYAGGIAGKNGRNATLTACRCLAGVSAASGGAGGLAGLNAGLITGCNADNFGVDGQSIVGGFAALNAASGNITNCTVPGVTIRGADMVGGAAAYNYGTISGLALNGATISAGGSYAGGAAAVNGGTIRDLALTNLTVSAVGTYGGGVTGDNRGSIALKGTLSGVKVSGGGILGLAVGYNRSGATLGTEENTTVTLESTCTVSGTGTVGGVVGVLGAGGSLSHFANSAAISATGGAAGGIAGMAETAAGTLQISDCVNSGPISGTAAAGGILGVSAPVSGANQEGAALVLARCQNFGRVGDAAAAQAGGILGGITANATQTTTVSGCTNTGLLLGAAAQSGGIAGLVPETAGTLVLINCINYGFAASDETGAFCGMTPSKALLSGCVGVAGCAYPLAKADQTTGDMPGWRFGGDAENEAGQLLTVQPEITDPVTYRAYYVAGETENVIFTGLTADPAALAADSTDEQRYSIYQQLETALRSKMPAA